MNLLLQVEHSTVECSSLSLLSTTLLSLQAFQCTGRIDAARETVRDFFSVFSSGLGRARGRAGHGWAWRLRRIVRPARPNLPTRRKSMPTSRPLPLLRPDRLRSVPRSFAWLDHRLRSAGLLARMGSEELGLYCFLALAADAQGRSCWRLDRVEREVPFDLPTLRRARDGLLHLDLIAYRPWYARATDGAYQLLSLPCVSCAAPKSGCSSIGDLVARLDLKR